MFVWQFVSLVSLYKLDKESFSDKINDAVYAAVYKLNVLLTDRYPSRDFAGVNASSSCVVYFHVNERDTIIYNSEIQLVDASNRAMYDIHASMWSLEKLDSLFQGQTRKIIGRVPIYYSLLDSVGKILQSCLLYTSIFIQNNIQAFSQEKRVENHELLHFSAGVLMMPINFGVKERDEQELAVSWSTEWEGALDSGGDKLCAGVIYDTEPFRPRLAECVKGTRADVYKRQP